MPRLIHSTRTPARPTITANYALIRARRSSIRHMTEVPNSEFDACESKIKETQTIERFTVLFLIFIRLSMYNVNVKVKTSHVEVLCIYRLLLVPQCRLPRSTN